MNDRTTIANTTGTPVPIRCSNYGDYTIMKITTKVLHVVDYSDLEKIIAATYYQDYELPYDEECNNDTSLTATVGKGQNTSDYDRKRLETFKDSGKGQYMMRPLLNDLADQNLIPEGEYLIEVSW